MPKRSRSGDIEQLSRRLEAPSAADRRTPVAVFAHVYYPEIWSSMARLLSERLTHPFELMVTTAGPIEAVTVPDTEALRDFRVLRVENRGRDILPFLTALSAWRDFDVGLKLHTKKSPQREDGDLWRDELLTALLPANGEVSRLIERIRRDDRIGFVAPGGFSLSVRPWIGINELGLAKIMRALDLEEHHLDDAFFAAGSMFWFRRDALTRLTDDQVLALFEPEAGQLDATTAHAMERAFPVAARGRGYASLAVPALLATHPSTSMKSLQRLARRHADGPSTFFPAPNVAALPPTPEGWRQARAIHRAGRRDIAVLPRLKRLYHRIVRRISSSV